MWPSASRARLVRSEESGNGNRCARQASQFLMIQYLRGIAALLVVFHHARNPRDGLFNPLVDFGAAAGGVDVFFVISGFIMFTAARTERPRAFFWKRLLRIAPMYWLATGLFVAMSAVRGDSFPTIDLLRSLMFVPYHNPHYDGSIWPILVPGWTLNYEMFFYLLFGFAIASGRLVSVVSALISGFVLLGLLAESENALFMTYTDPILLEFLAGVLLGKLFTQYAFYRVEMLLPLGFLALLCSDLYVLPRVVEGGIPAAAIVIGALAVESGGNVRGLALPKLIGDASYSIYLFHTSLLTVLMFAFRRLPIDGWPQFLGFIVVSLLLATTAGIMVHLLVEKPLLAFLKRLIPAKRSEVTLPRTEEIPGVRPAE
jgi:exopolysaccharide production protein ExoZ